MSIEDTIRAWKTNEEALEPCPVGRELTEEELLEVAGDCYSISVNPYCGNDQCTSSACRTSPSTDTTMG